jgi:hypothetical protein
MNGGQEVLMTKILFVFGAISGGFGMTLSDMDLLLGVALKFVSIVSFFIVILINFDKLIDTFKKWFTKS